MRTAGAWRQLEPRARARPSRAPSALSRQSHPAAGGVPVLIALPARAANCEPEDAAAAPPSGCSCRRGSPHAPFQTAAGASAARPWYLTGFWTQANGA